MRRNIVLLLAPALLWGASLALNVGAEEADPAKGKQLYEIYCQSCHGPAGDGKGPIGKALDPAPRDFTRGEFKFGGTDQDIFDVISNGAAAKGGSPLMAPWGAVIPEADRWALVKYIRSLIKK